MVRFDVTLVGVVITLSLLVFGCNNNPETDDQLYMIGELSGSGTLAGESISFDTFSDDVFGNRVTVRVEDDPSGKRRLFAQADHNPEGDWAGIEFLFGGTSPGTYTAPDVAWDGSFSAHIFSLAHEINTGDRTAPVDGPGSTLTIDQDDGQRLTGSYLFETVSGDTLSGDFDILFRDLSDGWPVR